MIFHVSIFIVIGVFFVSGLNIVNPGPKYPPTKGELWPKPQYQQQSDKYYVFKPSQFKVTIKGKTCDLLTAAVERLTFIVRNTNNLNRYHERIKERRMHTASQEYNDTLRLGPLKGLKIEMTERCENLIPQSGMDEGYNLALYDNYEIASLSCLTIWGCIRGLESWAQSFYFTDDFTELRINATHIVDFPRYPHRGLLIDTSRHFISLSNILKTLDAMSMNKMNVLHWHIVDDQSFPYESEVYPDLSRKGAYPSKVYSKADIATVVQYARERAIRVLPEFDVPGHTRSWGGAFPDILTKCFSDGEVVGLGPMDPTKNTTYKVLKSLFKEVQQRFPEKYLHVGGDEVELECWASNPDLQNYMKDHNVTVAQLHALFMENVLPLLGNKSQPLVWQEVFDEGVPLSSDTIVQVWKWDWVNEMVRILKSGHRLIFSAAWYLDHLQSGGDWLDFYLADPREMVRNKIGNTSTLLLENIMGGEACMWGEVVDDTNIISRVWPRASAVAERLWSSPMDYASKFNDNLDKVRSRLEEHTCRMQRVGIHAQPPNGPGFCVGAA